MAAPNAVCPRTTNSDRLLVLVMRSSVSTEFTKSISGARPHPNTRCRDAIREQIAAP